MKSIFSRLFGRGRHLSDLEKLLLNEVRSSLDREIVMLWDKQIQTINKVQRLPEGVEINFYHMKNGQPIFDDEIAFPNKTEELLISKVRVGLPNISDKLIANIWCVKGFLFSIEYEGSVSYFEEAIGMDAPPRFDINTEIKADLKDKRDATL